MKFEKAFLITFFLLIFALTSCSGQRSEIVGTWQRVTPSDNLFSFFTWADQIEFLKDGTFVLPGFNNTSGTYSFPENGRIKLEGPSGAVTYKFSLSGDKLIFEEDGQTIEYQRVK
jgi:hypothetical protein